MKMNNITKQQARKYKVGQLIVFKNMPAQIIRITEREIYLSIGDVIWIEE